MSVYLDLLGDFVESPSIAGPAIRERSPFGLGVIGFLIGGLSLFLAQSLSRHFFLLPAGPVALILICLWRLLFGVLMTGVLHLLAELSGGRGSSVGLFAFLGLSDLVWALALPFVVLLRLIGWSQSWFAVWVMLTVLGCFCVALRAKGLRENYGLTPGLSWMLVCVPYVATVVLTMAVISLAVFGAALSLIQLFT